MGSFIAGFPIESIGFAHLPRCVGERSRLWERGCIQFLWCNAPEHCGPFDRRGRSDDPWAPCTNVSPNTTNPCRPAFRHHRTMVIIRRHWNGDVSATVDADSLYSLHIRNEPGGVCSAFPRGFLCAHIWCDKMPAGSLGHICKNDGPCRLPSPCRLPGPHELLVYILPTDNPAETFDRLRAQARGQPISS